jgi:hypothetical protein
MIERAGVYTGSHDWTGTAGQWMRSSTSSADECHVFDAEVVP